MTTISPRECYINVAAAVKKQQDRLLIPEGSSSRSKGQKIMDALDRLYLAIINKYPEGIQIKKRHVFCKINIEQIQKLDLTTADEMLDAKIEKWEDEIEPWTEGDMEFNGRQEGYEEKISLRTALNISRTNIFNSVGGTWGPLWGKTRALELVEKELRI